VNISKFWISLDLKNINRTEAPGYYPGFIIFIKPLKIESTDFPKVIQYYKYLQESTDRLKSDFENFKIDTDSTSVRMSYKIVILDKNHKSIKWNKNLVAKIEFTRDLPVFKPVSGSFIGNKGEITGQGKVEFRFMNPVSVIKCRRNIELIEDIIGRKFPNFQFKYSTEESVIKTSAGNQRLVKSITVECLCIKKE
jgi:hypothetical protein